MQNLRGCRIAIFPHSSRSDDQLNYGIWSRQPVWTRHLLLFLGDMRIVIFYLLHPRSCVKRAQWGVGTGRADHWDVENHIPAVKDDGDYES